MNTKTTITLNNNCIFTRLGSWLTPAPLTILAALALALTVPARAETQPAAVPFSEIGARATADYHGAALGVTASSDGARLRCGFQKLQAHATPEGLWLESTGPGAAGETRLTATAIGRAGLSTPNHGLLSEAKARPVGNPSTTLPATGIVSVQDKLVRFTRLGLTEEYSVSLDGVRQDFVIAAPPAGAGDLRVELALSGARAEAATGGARLKLDGSGRTLAYSRLRVEDATGRELTARLEVLAVDRLAVSVADANASYPVRIDPTFRDALWASLGSGMNGSVYALAVSGTNLYAGGDFTKAGGVPAKSIAKWDGSTWSALGSGISGMVNALAVSGTNLYLGGWFTNAGGVPANYIAKWDGSTWSALGSGMNNYVFALAVIGTNLYAGGQFTTAGGVTSNSIAKWDGSAWTALGSGVNGYVRALGVIGTDLYAGGLFNTAGGMPANNIAKWNGSVWSALGDGLNSQVSALAVSGTNLYAGGDFATAGAVPASFAKWDGKVWTALGEGLSYQVEALAVSGTDLYAGGWFTKAGGVPANYIAKWDGSTWSALGSGMNNVVQALAADGAGHLFVGGYFSLAGTNVSPGIAEAIVGGNPPLIAVCSSNITIAATDPSGATVFYASSTRLSCSGASVTCNPPSGSTFPIGTTTVSCLATDSCGQTANCAFTVTVVKTPLIAVCSSNITVTATGPSGATVSYTSPFSGGCSGATVNCNPLSGSIFPIGTTTVSCLATDACGQTANCTFTVTVVKPPLAAVCPSDVAVVATDPGGATLLYASSTTGGCSGAGINCSPPSGSTFPIGTTTVSCLATDACGQTANCAFNVTVKASGGGTVTDCTESALRAAMVGGGVVTFTCDGTITLANTISNSMDTVLDASGHQVTISGGNAVRVFWVEANATLALVNLTIAHGAVNPSEPGWGGAGILNSGGTLNATNCTFSDNNNNNVGWPTEWGGAIWNQSGLLQLVACTFARNQASLPTSTLFAGQEVGGGAIWNSGIGTVDLCTFTSNQASGPPGNSYDYGGIGAGGSASGGAISNDGTLKVRRSSFIGNAVNGGAGGNGWGLDGNYPGASGGAGNGAAICNRGTLWLDSSTLVNNSATGGAGGTGGDGRPMYHIATAGAVGGTGGLGAGGGLFNSGTASAVNSTFAGNSGHGGPGGTGGIGGVGSRFSGYGGSGGTGGAGLGTICDSSGRLQLTNCTLAFNGASGGTGGAGGAGGGGAHPGGPGPQGTNGIAAGGIKSIGCLLVNSLLAANSVNCSGRVTDGGHNLSSDGTCAFTNAGSLNQTDPKLGPLADNGGPNLTMALLPGSPAIDAADPAAAPATDQRGFPRPAGLAAEIGAYELCYPAILRLSAPQASGVSIWAYGTNGQSCRLLSSPDLLNWVPVATNQIGSDGTILFNDSCVSGTACRFYRLVMP